ncbi:MAG: hypothetical protein AAF387_07895 [Pseudomonadota bacterium]
MTYRKMSSNVRGTNGGKLAEGQRRIQPIGTLQDSAFGATLGGERNPVVDLFVEQRTTFRATRGSLNTMLQKALNVDSYRQQRHPQQRKRFQ